MTDDLEVDHHFLLSIVQTVRKSDTSKQPRIFLFYTRRRQNVNMKSGNF
jgi:hypothetical protein